MAKEGECAGFRNPDDKKLKIVDGSSLSEPSQPDSESELNKFYRQKRESDGFDVDANPHKDEEDEEDFFSYFAAFNDPYGVPLRGKESTDLAMEAVEYHNLNKKPENANLEFVELVKFCHEYIENPYEMYYLTFDAKDVYDGSIQTCQAKVLCDFIDENTPYRFSFTPKVLIFRKKDPKLHEISATCGCQGNQLCGC